MAIAAKMVFLNLVVNAVIEVIDVSSDKIYL